MNESVKQVLSELSDNTELSAVVSLATAFTAYAFPSSGLMFSMASVVASFVTTKTASKAWSRVQYLAEATRIRVEDMQIELDQVRDFMKSDEFQDAVLRAIEVAAKSRSRLKADEAAKVLASSLRRQRIEFGYEEYLSTLLELSENELLVAKVIFEMQKSHVYHQLTDIVWMDQVKWSDLPERLPLELRSHLPFLLARIARTGLIAPNQARTLGSIGESLSAYHVTDTFRVIMSLIDDERRDSMKVPIA